MKNTKNLVLMLVAIMLICSVCIFTACDGKGQPVYYTVSFNTDGAQAVPSQSVEDGNTAVEPLQPTKTGYVFGGWYNGETIYDFSAPVKSDITLVARWSDRQYTVTFKSDGATISTSNVVHGNKVARPVSDPQKAEHYFNGWLLGGNHFDFNTPITADVTIEADWISNASINAALQTALRADYSNYTMVYSVNEEVDDEVYTMTYTYKRDGNDYYTKLEQEGLPTVERWVVFDNSGKILDCFYKNGNEWKRGASDVVHYYIPFKYTDLTSADFYYASGKYFLDNESMSCFEYETFGTVNSMSLSDVSLTVDGGHIAHIEGMMDGEAMSFTQDVSALGTTELTRPSFPQSVVTISKNKLSGEDAAGVKTVTEGTPITITQLKALFTLKIDGVSHSEKITDDIIDIGTLDLENPVAGTYPIRLAYTAWDCTVAVSETAAVEVKSAQPPVKTLADILAEDYTNATIKVGAYNTVRDGNWYDMTFGMYHYFLIVDDSFDGGYTRVKLDRNNNITLQISSSDWKQFLRLDLVTGLDAGLFADNGDGTYTLGSDSEPSQDVKDVLLAIFTDAYSSKPITGSIKMSDESKPYSLTLEVADEKLSKVTVAYYYGNASKTFTFTISNVGTADPISSEVKTDIENAFHGYTVTYKSGEHGTGADAVYEKQPHGTYNLAENPFTAESGYVFIGWKEEGSAASDPVLPVNNSYTLTKNAVFVAQWSVAYTVTYKPGEHAHGDDAVRGNLPSGNYTVESCSADKWANIDSGYTFAGWKLEGTDTVYQPEDTYILTDNAVFIAQWQATGSDTPTYTIASAIGLGSSPMKMVSEIQINEATGEITFTYTTSSNPTAQTITVTATKGDYYFESDQYAGYQIYDSQISTSYTYVIKLSDDKSTLEVWDWNDDDEYAETCVGTFTKA